MFSHCKFNHISSVIKLYPSVSVNQCWTEQRFLAKRSQANKRFGAKSMYFKLTNVASFKPAKCKQIIFNDDIFLHFLFFSLSKVISHNSLNLYFGDYLKWSQKWLEMVEVLHMASLSLFSKHVLLSLHRYVPTIVLHTLNWFTAKNAWVDWVSVVGGQGFFFLFQRHAHIFPIILTKARHGQNTVAQCKFSTACMCCLQAPAKRSR